MNPSRCCATLIQTLNLSSLLLFHLAYIFFDLLHMLAKDEMHMFRHLIRNTKSPSSPAQMANRRLFFVQIAGIYLRMLGQSHIDLVFR